MTPQGHHSRPPLCTIVTPCDDTAYMENDIDTMTPAELRAALRAEKTRADTEKTRADTEKTRADTFEQALMTEQSRYAVLVSNHPLMQERLWLTRTFRTCSTQHFVTGYVIS